MAVPKKQGKAIAMKHDKYEDPLRNIRNAVKIGDLCFEYILGEIKPGTTEVEIAEKIDAFLLSHGGECLAFPTICVSGARGWLMHGEPSDKKIEKGEFVTMDFGAVVGGYCGDMTRTVAIGRVGHEESLVYDLVHQSMEAGIAALGADAFCRDVDRAARTVLNVAGYGGNFTHGTGHGVGRKVHEPPTLNRKSEERLKPGDAVTVEPGVYVENRFGVRIEDLFIIADTDIINVTRSDKRLIVL
jgi:Xaa-Pro aminopeptidase